MKIASWLGVLLLLALPLRPADAGVLLGRWELDRINRQLHGRILDFTHNHGADHRIWSPSLCERRDLYVYLPPCFDPNLSYPFMMWLHGFGQDEKSYIHDVAERLDRAIVRGELPPMIVAVPDGSLSGWTSAVFNSSGFINSKAGRFGDFVMHDVWNFMMCRYPIRPEREAHILAGVSMGGASCYHLAFKYPEHARVLCGIFPPLNSRWVDCHGQYRRNFDPECWGWRETVRGRELIGILYGVPIRLRTLMFPLYGRGNESIPKIAADNPAEMLDAYDIQPGVYAMYVAYGGRDNFNIDAQVESFLYLARQRGLCVDVSKAPLGKHNRPTAFRLFPGVIRWLALQVAPYAPCQQGHEIQFAPTTEDKDDKDD